jgi:hypothetical protein
MKIKVLGMTVFELQRDPPALHPDRPSSPRAASAKPRCSTPAAVSPPLRPLADLHAAAEFLPRTSRGTLDVNATLRLFGLKDASVLWQQKYPTGSAGAALKRALGALGRKPAVSPRRTRQDPEGGGSAAKQPPALAAASMPPAKPRAIPTQSGKDASAGEKIQAPLLARDADGRIDIAASLQMLGLANPLSLWSGKIQPGSMEHELKKEIARLLARGETVHGITRVDIGLAG